MLSRIKDLVTGKAPAACKRSGHWPAVRKAYLTRHAECAACGGTTKLEVHHIVPFHLDPTRELDETNLIVLCESGKNGVVCHRAIGHLGDYSSHNPSVVVDAEAWRRKVDERP